MLQRKRALLGGQCAVLLRQCTVLGTQGPVLGFQRGVLLRQRVVLTQDRGARIDLEAKPKAAAKEKAPPKKKKVLSGSEDDDDEIEPPPAVAKVERAVPQRATAGSRPGSWCLRATATICRLYGSRTGRRRSSARRLHR